MIALTRKVSVALPGTRELTAINFNLFQNLFKTNEDAAGKFARLAVA